MATSLNIATAQITKKNRDCQKKTLKRGVEALVIQVRKSLGHKKCKKKNKLPTYVPKCIKKSKQKKDFS